MRADLHVHSSHSKRPSIWVLRKLGCAESYTDPLGLYRIARDRGMDAVTITDHNSIDGCAEIAHLPGVFTSAEVTTYFPDDGCKLHVLVYNITGEQFGEIDRLRENVFDLAAFIQREAIVHSLAHPLFSINDRLDIDHFEKCLLLFRNFELNGDEDETVNRVLEEIISSLGPVDMERLSARHGITPVWPEPWRKGFTGGSDDHSSMNIATTFTEVEGAADIPSLLDGVAGGRGRVLYRRPSTPDTMGHHIYSVAYQFYKQKFDLRGNRSAGLLNRFLERVLLYRGGTEHPGVLARVYCRVKKRMNGRGEPRPNSSMTELLQREAEKLIERDPQIAGVMKSNGAVREPATAWAHFINEVSNNILAGLSDGLAERLFGANIFDIFHTMGSAGALYTLSAPYFISYAVYSKTRLFGKRVHRHFTARLGPGPEPNVAIFTDTLDEVNGVARTLERQRRSAKASDRELTLVTCATEGWEDVPGVKRFDPVRVHRLPEYGEQRIFIPPLLEMIRFCYEQDFTHIHAATPGPIGLAAMFIARVLDLPFVSTYHTKIPQYALHFTSDHSVEDVAWRYMTWFYSQCRMVFAPSADTAAELAGKGVPEDRILLMPRGVDIEYFHPGNAPLHLGRRGGVRFLYAGRVSCEKNLEMLVRAFRRLNAFNPEATLVVAGDGPWLEEMQTACDGLPVVFTGYLHGEDLTGVYTACDAFVFPSTTDTFGNVVLEAQASGLPVIVTDRGGPRENMIPGETGLLVGGSDEEGFFMAMRALCTDEAKRLDMGMRARRYAENRSYPSAFSEYWQYYRVPFDVQPSEPGLPEELLRNVGGGDFGVA